MVVSGTGKRILAKAKEYQLLLATIAVIMIVFTAMTAYSGVWPPLVVVESSSMQHSDDTSSMGVIDTGDMVMIKAQNQEPITYVEGYLTGHRTYSGYGDVIVYRPYGDGRYTPIIHRAICWLEYNESGDGSFDLPELAAYPSEMWESFFDGNSQGQRWWDLTGMVKLYQIGYANVTVEIDLASILYYMETHLVEDASGYVTMGDHNWVKKEGERIGIIDQYSIVRLPIDEDWIIGVARGELPWFGLIKLYLTGTAPDNGPGNSITNLVICLALIVILPLGVDYTMFRLDRRGIHLFKTKRGSDDRPVRRSKRKAK